MTRLLGVLTVLVLAIGLGAAPTAASVDAPSGVAAKRDVPSRDQWLADVAAAMAGSRSAVRQRIAAKNPDERLAVNFDIDNTVLASYYDGGGVIPRMLAFTRFLERRGVAVLFNTGRLASLRRSTDRQLERNGFPVDGLCLRAQGRPLAFGKQRCRDRFTGAGYTLIANVGNNDTDFEGDGYERAYRLPNYAGALG
jgi:predicted secreted acid phosphatase